MVILCNLRKLKYFEKKNLRLKTCHGKIGLWVGDAARTPKLPGSLKT
jgi:hypothetical protein